MENKIIKQKGNLIIHQYGVEKAIFNCIFKESVRDFLRDNPKTKELEIICKKVYRDENNYTYNNLTSITHYKNGKPSKYFEFQDGEVICIKEYFEYGDYIKIEVDGMKYQDVDMERFLTDEEYRDELRHAGEVVFRSKDKTIVSYNCLKTMQYEASSLYSKLKRGIPCFILIN